MHRTAIALSLVVASATVAEGDQSKWSPAQAEVWRTVEARTDAWVRNDYEAYLSLHHERWRRFSMIKSELTSKDDVARFWKAMKVSEKVHSIELTPIAVEVYAGGSVAIAHYVMMETLEWTAETQRRASGRLMEKGRVYRVPARFSDVYVKEDGRWLYVGGYRDLTCDIMPESPFPCLDIRDAAQQGAAADEPQRSPTDP
jgi:ketosteroid isomerase-like protein